MEHFNTVVIYCRILTLEDVGSVVNYRGIFIASQQLQLFLVASVVQDFFAWSGDQTQDLLVLFHSFSIPLYRWATVTQKKVASHWRRSNLPTATHSDEGVTQTKSMTDAELRFKFVTILGHSPGEGSAKANGREPKSSLGQVLNFKLGCFCYKQYCKD